jgi:hypothetical protein
MFGLPPLRHISTLPRADPGRTTPTTAATLPARRQFREYAERCRFNLGVASRPQLWGRSFSVRLGTMWAALAPAGAPITEPKEPICCVRRSHTAQNAFMVAALQRTMSSSRGTLVGDILGLAVIAFVFPDHNGNCWLTAEAIAAGMPFLMAANPQNKEAGSPKRSRFGTTGVGLALGD